MVDIFRFLFVAGVLRAAITTALFAALSLWSLKVIVLPYTIDPLEIDVPLILFKLYCDLAIAESWPLL